MSTNATKWTWDLRGVSFGPKIVLLCIADHADKFGKNAFPGINLISAECGMARRAVINNLHRLEEMGLIIRTKRKGGQSGGSMSNLYELDFSRGAPNAPSPRADFDDPSTSGPEQGFSRGASAAPSTDSASAAPPPDSASEAGDSASEAGDSAADAPEPSVEPPVEPKEGRTRARDPLFGFERFWKAYPPDKRKSENLARDLWVRERLFDRAEQIVADVQARTTGDRQWVDGFAPYPVTYIRHGRWNDALEPLDSQQHRASTGPKSPAQRKVSNLLGAMRGFLDDGK